jgi:hypothetical protein
VGFAPPRLEKVGHIVSPVIRLQQLH